MRPTTFNIISMSLKNEQNPFRPANASNCNSQNSLCMDQF